MKFSIIVPVYNDRHIADCLESIFKLHYPQDQFEVIVVDNNSDPAIKGLVKNFSVGYVRESVPGSYKARNTGATQAQGEILVFTDSDCVVSPGWLHEIEQTLISKDVAAVMGYSGGNDRNAIARYEQRMYEQNIAAFAHEADLRRIDTRNFAVRRSVFKQVGEFTDDLAYGGDMEYGARLHASKFGVRFNKDMVVIHTNPTNLRTLLAKRIRQNFGNMKIIELHTPQFVMKYFPHLLRYKPSVTNIVLWWCMRLWVWMIFPFSHITCILLPSALGYWYFKVNNVIAMRFGQLSYILHKRIS